MFCFFFFKQKTAYEMLRSLVGSEMCIRDRLYLHPLASDTDFWASEACLLSFLLYFRLLLVQQDHRKYVRSFHTFPTVLYRYIFQTFAVQGFWLEFLPLFQVENIFGYLHLYTFISDI